MKHSDSLELLKAQYHQIDIPKDLSSVVDDAILQGLKSNAQSEQQETRLTRSKSIRYGRRTLATAAAILVLFTAAINLSPNFANAAAQLPFIGQLVKVLDFKNGIASGGTRTDGTDISEVNLSQINGYEAFDIVFEQNSVPQEMASAYDIKYQEHPYTLILSLHGVRMMSAATEMKEIKDSPLVKQVYPIVTLDDSTIRFGIEFKQAVLFKVSELKSPSRLVIELAKDDHALANQTYQVVTQNMPAGEGIAMAEEMLFNDFEEMRVLPSEEKDLYYLELGQYESQSEAEEAILKAKDIGLTATFRIIN